MLYENIQYLLLQQLKKNQLKDSEGELLKTFEKTLHMFPGIYAIRIKNK